MPQLISSTWNETLPASSAIGWGEPHHNASGVIPIGIGPCQSLEQIQPTSYGSLQWMPRFCTGS
jgi:hypothetical protein